MSDFNDSLVSFLIYHVPHQQALSLDSQELLVSNNVREKYESGKLAGEEQSITIKIHLSLLWPCIPSSHTTTRQAQLWPHEKWQHEPCVLHFSIPLSLNTAWFLHFNSKHKRWKINWFKIDDVWSKASSYR